MLGAVELGGSKVLCAVGDAHDRIAHEARIETTTPEATLASVIDFFSPHASALSALGVASFGPLELRADRGAARGTLLSTPKLGWSSVNIRRVLQDALGVPVQVDTDVNAASLAEQRWGHAIGADPCVYVTVGTGIGVGVVIDGRPLHGLMHPELGHMRAPRGDPFAGICPFHGNCIEGLASAPSLRARLGVAPESVADDHPVWALEAQHLATLLSTIVLAYAPERIVLAGGVLQRPGLLERTREAVLRELAGYVPRIELSADGVKGYVVASRFGMRAGLVGAFALL
jgi:fructokinase